MEARGARAREAVILVGGQGSRLRPLTLGTAKPLLPVAGLPFVVHQLAKLAAAGIEHVVMATSYRASTFAESLGDGAALGLRVEYVTETEPLGTGGAIRNVADRLEAAPDEPVVVLNGDILSGHDLPAQLDRHQASDADVTLHLTEAEDPRQFGVVPTDGDGRVLAFHEKMAEPVSSQINAGCYVFRRKLIDTIPDGRPVSVERETFPQLLADGSVVIGHLDASYWMDLGSAAAYVQGCRDVVLGRIGSHALPVVPGEKLLLDGAEVDPAALVRGGSTIGRGARVAPGAVVEGSVLLDGAVVEREALVRDSVIGSEARVGERTVVRDAVVGDRSDTGADNELIAAVRLWSDRRLPDASLRFTPPPAT
ncbi:MAG: sugar phosphate nucleotidyltransferase [Actinomycetales bacterium]